MEVEQIDGSQSQEDRRIAAEAQLEKQEGTGEIDTYSDIDVLKPGPIWSGIGSDGRKYRAKLKPDKVIGADGQGQGESERLLLATIEIAGSQKLQMPVSHCGHTTDVKTKIIKQMADWTQALSKGEIQVSDLKTYREKWTQQEGLPATVKTSKPGAKKKPAGQGAEPLRREGAFLEEGEDDKEKPQGSGGEPPTKQPAEQPKEQGKDEPTASQNIEKKKTEFWDGPGGETPPASNAASSSSSSGARPPAAAKATPMQVSTPPRKRKRAESSDDDLEPCSSVWDTAFPNME